MGYIKPLVNSGLLAMLVVLSGCAQLHKAPESKVRHTVLVWLKPEYQSAEYIQLLTEKTEQLRAIPGIVTLSVGTPIPSERPIVDDSFDLGVLMTFTDTQAMNRYLSHPAHTEFVSSYIRGKTEKIKVYDF